MMAVSNVNWNWARIYVMNTDIGSKHTNGDDAELLRLIISDVCIAFEI